VVAWLHEWTTTWHDAWDILGAIATAGAVVVAMWGVRREARARKVAEERAAAAEEARSAERASAERYRASREAAQADGVRRSQALQVIAWLEEVPATHVISDGSGEPLSTMFRCRYVNHSSSPLFDVRLRVFVSGLNEFIEVLQVPVIPGDVRETAPVPEEIQRERGRHYEAIMDFRDLRGVRWRRTQSGRLLELDEAGNLR
jgi:hypothetical protein